MRTPRKLILLAAGLIFLALDWFIQDAASGPVRNGHRPDGTMYAEALVVAVMGGWLLARALARPFHERRQRLAEQNWT